MRRMQRRKFTQLVLSGLAVGLGACATPATSQNSSSAAVQPQPVEPVNAVATPRPKAAKPVEIAPAVATPTAESVAAVLIQPTPPPEPLPEGPLAPFVKSDTWLNTAKPIAWDSLRGTVTMVEFWTIGCINCQNVIPDMKAFYKDFKDKGFTIVGVHSPEFDYEKQLGNVKNSVKKWGIEYPVAIDNDFENWNRYRNRYWPARYLVDKRGVVRHTHIGEGGYEETRGWIEKLIAE